MSDRRPNVAGWIVGAGLVAYTFAASVVVAVAAPVADRLWPERPGKCIHGRTVLSDGPGCPVCERRPPRSIP